MPQGLKGTLAGSTTMLISLEYVSFNVNAQEHAQSLLSTLGLSGIDLSTTLF